MWRRICLSLICLFWCVHSSLADMARTEFDARALDYSEKRYLQGALTITGDYNGLIDGAWGGGSASALQRWAGNGQIIRFATLRPLIHSFQSELDSAGWAALNLGDFNLSFQMPFKLLVTDQSTTHPTFQTRDRSLLIRAFFENTDKTVDMHRWQHDNHAGVPSSLYSNYRKGRLITSAQLSSGKRAYLRSDRDGPGYFSVLVQYEPWQTGRGQLVASSIRRGSQSDFSLPAGGILQQLMVNKPPQPPAMAVVTPDPPKPRSNTPKNTPDAAAKGSGTGFYINNTDIVTAAHVIDGCTALGLDGGAPLSVILSDSALDLAVLSTARRSASWLPLSGQTEPKLGEDVVAIGFPYRGLFDQGLTVTGGNISALPSATDPAKRVMLTSPIQPGNSGGPVLNKGGEVVGVVVSRANDLAVLEGTGTLPQNINFAVSTAPLLTFLDKADVFFPTGTDRAAPLTDGIPPATQAAIVAILCY